MFFKPNTHESAVLRAWECRAEAKFSSIPFSLLLRIDWRLPPLKAEDSDQLCTFWLGHTGTSVGQGQLWAGLPGWVDAIWRQCHVWHSRTKGTERTCGATEAALPHTMVGHLSQNNPCHVWEPGDRGCMTEGCTPPPPSPTLCLQNMGMKGKGHFWEWEQPLGVILMDPCAQQPSWQWPNLSTRWGLLVSLPIQMTSWHWDLWTHHSEI